MSSSQLIDLVTTGGTLGALVAVLVLLIAGEFRLKREVIDRDTWIANAKEQTEVWRQAHAKEQAARAETEKALAESLESARVMTRLLESLQQRGQRDAG